VRRRYEPGWAEAIVDRWPVRARRIEVFRALHHSDATEAFRLRWVVELFHRHRELLDAGCDAEAGVILQELADVASERSYASPSACVQMQKVWWARALCDAQARAEALHRIVAVVSYAERGYAVRRGVPDLEEIDDAIAELLERSHAALLGVGSIARAADALGELRRIATRREGDVEERRARLARALCRLHALVRTAGDAQRADAVLDEIRSIAARPPAMGLRAVALTEALLCAQRSARGRARALLLIELRQWAQHPCARQESRNHWRAAVTSAPMPAKPLPRAYRSDA
jgi:hypothetical protein